jgi:hypothetical protein
VAAQEADLDNQFIRFVLVLGGVKECSIAEIWKVARREAPRRIFTILRFFEPSGIYRAAFSDYK